MKASFRRDLLGWYRREKRDLPWRRTRDPYAIWLSEIMLQQTTVATVVPYYENFLKRFPTVFDVVDQTDRSDEKLLKAWAGLGYYSRVRNFAKACRVVVEEYGGIVPASFEDLKKLPGIGNYTAAAIASIAFDIPVAVVDGNVMRVLSRLLCCDEDISGAHAKEVFQKMADEALEKKHPGDFNQAMMELGAMVCTPRAPACSRCPVQKHCEAFKAGSWEKYPVKSRKISYRDEKWFCLVAQDKQKIFLRRRAVAEGMEGLWELPMTRDWKGLEKARSKKLKPVRHTIMNRRMTVIPVLSSDFVGLEASGRWVREKDLSAYPLSTITRKVLLEALR